MQILSHHKCQVCHKEVQTQLLLTDVAYYSVQTGNLIMVSRLACKICREEIVTIRKFVEDNGLNFGKNTMIYQELVDLYLQDGVAGFANLARIDESQLYNKHIEQEIKRNKLYHCAKLPMNCLQLVYYSSISINHAERHERIRNTIGECMRIVPIPYANLEDIAILVHCLSCFMHQTQVVQLVRLICERVIVEGSPLPEVQVEIELPIERLWKELYSNYYIGNILVVISELLRNWRGFDSSFEKLRAYHGYIKKQKIKELIAHNFNSPTKKNVSLSIDANSTTALPHHIASNCKQCNRHRVEYLLNQARMKNLFALTLKTLIKEDAAHREHALQLQAKFLREKEEFINKIIKLKDKIELLEHQDEQDAPLRRARSASEYQVKRHHHKSDLEAVSQKSQGTNKTIEIKEKNDENIQAQENQKEKAKENQAVLIGSLQRLLTNLPEFEPSLLASDADHKILLETIQISLKKMREQLQKLDKKNKLLEHQSKRLLTILTRKEQRFVPLIHEKDEIIQKYENALWKMQHGLIVQDPALAPRIANIINVFKSDFMESLSNGTLESDRYIDQVHSSPQVQKQQKKQATPAKTSKKKNKQKQKITSSSEQKVKNGDKDCTIF